MDYPIVKNRKTLIPYEYLGQNKFRNLHTQKEGEVPEDKAKEVFIINLDVAKICLDNPNVKTLIKELKLFIQS